MGGRSTLGDLVFMLWDIPCVNIPSLIHSRWRMFGLWCVCLLKASVCQDFFAQDKSVSIICWGAHRSSDHSPTNDGCCINTQNHFLLLKYVCKSS